MPLEELWKIQGVGLLVIEERNLHVLRGKGDIPVLLNIKQEHLLEQGLERMSSFQVNSLNFGLSKIVFSITEFAMSTTQVLQATFIL